MAEIDDALGATGKYVGTSLLGSVFIIRGMARSGRMNPTYARAILLHLGKISGSENIAKNFAYEAAVLIAQRPNKRVKRRE